MDYWFIGRVSLVGSLDLGPIALRPLPRSSTTGRGRYRLAAFTHHTLLARLDTDDGSDDAADHLAVARHLPPLDQASARPLTAYNPRDRWLLGCVDELLGLRPTRPIGACIEMVERSPWLEANAWAIGASTLLLAGGFQFSRLKYRCLDKCRAPLSFVMQYWQGRHDRQNAFWLGIHHGFFCVGCCWALMLLMFAVGVGNIAWMLALGALMAVEKNLPWGRKLSGPLGLALLAWGGAIFLSHFQS